ncbi:MAG TPA: hypothetical protein VN176_04040 [Verrucomicrobiae bacterium]|nr:hypothetical protein [Verrucomicrobiae bacterium]
MSVSRRDFLHKSVLLAAGAALPTAFFGANQRRATNDPVNGAVTSKAGVASGASLPQWNKGSFLSCVGSEFSVQIPGGQTSWLVLDQVIDFPAPAAVNPASFAVPPPKLLTAPPATESYLLVFRGTPNPSLPQGTYVFDHHKLGQFSLLIVPGGPQMYSAVINRLTAGPLPSPHVVGPPVSDGGGFTPGTSSGPSSGGSSSPSPASGPASGSGPDSGVAPKPEGVRTQRLAQPD